MVCSLSCVGLLKANEKDSCNYCKRPVWKDNYYEINNDIYCSDLCKQLILEELKMPKDSDLINHFNENTFANINPVTLKNSIQLREEVLKVYNDFEFDIIDESNDNLNQIENKLNEIRKNINNKDQFNKENKKTNVNKYKQDNDLTNININYLLKNDIISLDISKNIRKNMNNYKEKEISKENDLINVQNNDNKNISKDNNSYQIMGHKVKKTYTFNNIPNHFYYKTNENKYKNKISNAINVNKYENYYTYKRYKDGEKKPKISINIDNNYDNNYSHNYNTISQNLSINNELNNTNRNNSNEIRRYKKYIKNEDLNSNKKNNNPMKLTKINKICKNCFGKLGNMKFLDRDGNIFCSDKCKKEFFSLKIK